MYEHKNCSEALNTVTNVLLGSKNVEFDTKIMQIPEIWANLRQYLLYNGSHFGKQYGHNIYTIFVTANEIDQPKNIGLDANIMFLFGLELILHAKISILAAILKIAHYCQKATTVRALSWLDVIYVSIRSK